MEQKSENQNAQRPPSLDRRSAMRLTCQSPISFKVCKEETISKILEGYTKDISKGGVRIVISQKVPVGCTLWLKLDRDALSLCEELEKNALILQQGIIGRVVWVDQISDKECDIGLQFITRQALES